MTTRFLRASRWLFLLLSSCPLLVGCGNSQAQPQGQAKTIPEVDVSLPVTRSVIDYEDFPGRIEAVNTVDIRARVTGYLDKDRFKEGTDVKQGALLFEIDARQYQAELARAEGNVLQGESRLKRLEADLQRAKNLYPRGAIGREEYDKITGDYTEASGALMVAQANLKLARLNMEYTKVRAPLNGRISRRNFDPGNMVKADDTILTTIVSLDPIYAYFDLDERTTLRLQRLIREGKIPWSQEGGLAVLLGLADEDGFPKRGVINFADNRLDPDTGTWRLRGLFQNADHALAPGLFVRIRLPIGKPFQALLVAEQALSTDQGQKSVYVVDDAGKVAAHRVKVGRLHDGLRVITEGLKGDEKVVVNGLQLVRQDSEAKVVVVDMPVISDTPQLAK